MLNEMTGSGTGWVAGQPRPGIAYAIWLLWSAESMSLPVQHCGNSTVIVMKSPTAHRGMGGLLAPPAFQHLQPTLSCGPLPFALPATIRRPAGIGLTCPGATPRYPLL